MMANILNIAAIAYTSNIPQTDIGNLKNTHYHGPHSLHFGRAAVIFWVLWRPRYKALQGPFGLPDVVVPYFEYGYTCI